MAQCRCKCELQLVVWRSVKGDQGRLPVVEPEGFVDKCFLLFLVLHKNNEKCVFCVIVYAINIFMHLML